MIKAVLFDFNETLIHSPEWMSLETKELPNAALSSLVQAGHLPELSDEQISTAEAIFRKARQTANSTNRETSHVSDLIAMIDALGYQHLLPRSIMESTVAALHRDCVPKVILLPHTKRMLERLDELGLRMGIISNAAYSPFLSWTLGHFGVLEFFEDILVSADIRLRKPALEIFHVALRRMQLQPKDVAYVGDDFQKDVVPSKQIGLRAIWRKPEVVSSGPDKDTTPDAVITNNEEIPPLAEQWMLA